MRYLALATDYDSTLAHDGRVSNSTVAALERLIASGRRVILVTGRELDNLRSVFPRMELFDAVVAENGGLLYLPQTHEEKLLSEPVNQQLVEWLKARGVPVSTGPTVISTSTPHEKTVLEGIRQLGLELHVIFNRGSVMVLPSGINKGTGLRATLRSLGLSPHNVAGIGDAENDPAFLSLCECSVAVANAIEPLKQRVDVVTRGADGAGVTEIIEQMLSDDLSGIEDRLVRRQILFGQDGDEEVRVPAYGTCMLVAGPSGSGKSTIVAGMLERICAADYQYCVVDPEGDFSEVPGGVVLGDAGRVPGTEEVLQLVDAFNNTSVNLLGVAQADRPNLFAGLLPKLQERRVRTGRPHWLILDETHHLLPESWRPAPFSLPQALGAAIMVTVHPEHVSVAALTLVNVVAAVGKDPAKTLQTFATVTRRNLPPLKALGRETATALVWDLRAGTVRNVIPEPPQAERRRHFRKYAEGDIHEKSFYFRGPHLKLNLRAQNLILFVQMAAGVDDETWDHHLQQRDYSRWIREAIKDRDLADTVAAIETQQLGPDESRRRILAAIENKYTRAA